MVRAKRILGTALAVGLCMSGFAAQAEAGFLIGGHTRGDGGGADGSISFAVYDTSGGSLGDMYGTGFAGFDDTFMPGTEGADSPDDLTGNYLYLYQLVNDGDATGPSAILSRLSVGLNSYSSSDILAWGSFEDLGFEDGDGEIAAGNPLGPNGTPFSQGSPGVLAGSVPSIVSIAGSATRPVTVTNGFDTFAANYDKFVAGELGVDARSIIVGFTSNVAPGFGSAAIIDGGSSANTTVTTLAPAPPALAMLLSGFPALGLCFMRRRLRKSAGSDEANA